jgi:hypothetical protein
MDGVSEKNVTREGNYVVSDVQIIQSPATTVGQVESERSTSVSRILNHHRKPLKFQRGLCQYHTSLGPVNSTWASNPEEHRHENIKSLKIFKIQRT